MLPTPPVGFRASRSGCRSSQTYVLGEITLRKLFNTLLFLHLMKSVGRDADGAFVRAEAAAVVEVVVLRVLRRSEVA